MAQSFGIKSSSGVFSIKRAYRIKGYWCLVALWLVFIGGLTGAANAQDNSLLPLKWEAVDKPGFKGEIVIFGSEINRIAISHDVVYALDTANGWLHRSDNGGVTFDNITQALSDAGVSLPLHEIAVAPDMSQYVAVSDDNSMVYWSSDAGVTWNNTLFPPVTDNSTIQCIAISSGYTDGVSTENYHDLAVGTAAWNNNINTAGGISTIKVGKSLAGWQNQNLTISSGVPGAEVSAIAFAPKYNADRTILAVASTKNDTAGHLSDNSTWLCIGQINFSPPATWNAQLPIASALAAAGDNVSSSIALPSDYNYSSGASTFRKVFVNYKRDKDNQNDVYRFDDTIKQQLLAPNRSDGISSIAYYGTSTQGKLLSAGTKPAGFSVQVYRSDNPLYAPGPVTWYPATQPPSGPGNALVAWNSKGTIAFCGTGQDPSAPLDESAFSQSSDDWDTWTQTGLINTIIQMSDVAPAPNSKSLFMATFSNGITPEGVWRCAGEPIGTYWARLLTMRTSSDMVLLRLSPDYSNDYTIYAVEAGSDNRTLLEVSTNQGNTWKQRYVPGPVTDMIAASKDTLYMALPGGVVRKSTDGGLKWGESVMTGLDDINMLALAANGHLFAGSMDSKVAYSTDNGTSFIEIENPIGLGTGCVQVAADADYPLNNIIYAADNISDKGVWRWIIGQSTEWEQIDETITRSHPGQIISGLITGPEGTLYPLRAERPKPDNRTMVSNNHTGGMNRTLNPTAGQPINIEWDIVNRTLTDNNTAFDQEPLKFTNNPPWIKLSGNSNENELWTIDTADLDFADDTAQIYRFRDNLCKIGPWINGPSEVGCDPVSGRNDQVDLAWEQLSLTDRYELQLAKDRNFTLRINPEISAADNISAVIGSILINTDAANVNYPTLWLPPGSLPEAGSFYYWRVRCIRAATWEFIRSPWSDTLCFMVSPGFPVTSAYYGSQLLAPEDGCECPCNSPVSFSWSPFKETTSYKFELSENYDMSQPLVSASLKTTAYRYDGQLECNKSYYWRVMALEPVAGDWSATFSYQVQPAQSYQAPAERNGSAPLWAWIGIIVGIVTSFVLFIIILLRQLEIL
ncbi:MAG: hypothetical protein PHU70_04440 [Dehalococcoidia bacterium]|nr:hypothetical protein [Dehalococcoidia bacterium]